MKNPAQMYYLYLDTNSMTKLAAGALDQNDEKLESQPVAKDFMMFSEKDLFGIVEIHNYEGDLFKLLVHSFCPAIYGHEIVKVQFSFRNIKAGILLTLFGGRKRDDEASKVSIRSDPHILIVGDPGLGKR